MKTQLVYTLLLILALAGCRHGGIDAAQSAQSAAILESLPADDLASISYFHGKEQALRDHPADAALRRSTTDELLLILESDASPAIRQSAAALLCRLAGPEDLPRLSNLMKKETHRRAAFDVICSIPDDKALKHIRSAASSDDAALRLQAINEIGLRKDRGGVRPLATALDDPNPRIRIAAMRTLAALGDHGTLINPESSISASDAHEQREAQLAHILAAGSYQPQEARRIYTNDGLGSSFPVVRSTAFLALLDLGGPEASELLMRELGDPASPLHRLALQGMASHPRLGADEEILSLAGTLPPDSQAPSLDGLAERAHPGIAQLALPFLGSPETAVRLSAIAMIGRLGGAGEVVPLATHAARSSGDEREAAQRALTVLQGPGIDELMIKGLEQPDHVSVYMQALADRSVEAAIPSLLAIAGGEDSKSAGQALEALASFAPDSTLPQLLSILGAASQKSLRSRAEDAYVAVARRGDRRHATTLVTIAFPSSPAAIQPSLLSVIGRIGDPTGLTLLGQVAGDATSPIRRDAVRALAQWPDATPAVLLAGIAESESDPVLRRLAIRGFLELASREADIERRWALYDRATPLATQAEEKRLLVAGIAGIGTLAAMDALAPWLDDADVRQEAAIALANLAQSLASSHPGEVKHALQQALARMDNDRLREEFSRFSPPLSEDGHILVWDFSGPLSTPGIEDIETLHATVYPPEEGGGAWTMIRGGGDPNTPWLVDLNRASGSDQLHCVGYLRTWLRSPAQRRAVLEVGSDDAVKIWLNGALVHDHVARRSATPSSDIVIVDLVQGTNELTAKITQGEHGWGFCLRVSELPGTPLGGTEVKGDGQFMIPLPTKPFQGKLPETAIPPPVWSTEKWQGDNYTGDWEELSPSGNSGSPLRAQLVPLGSGRFRLQLLDGFDKGHAPIAVLEGSLQGEDLAMEGDGWQARIASGGLECIRTQDGSSRLLSKVERLSPTLGAKPPAGAIVLFDGTDFDQWYGEKDGTVTWRMVEGGAMQVSPQTGGIITRQAFTDFDLHLEFRAPYSPGNEHQFNGNSGVFLQMAYEVQILASYGAPGLINECGAIYNRIPPAFNMCAPPLQWQTYDISFTAARFDGAGQLLSPARVTVLHNGVAIHSDRELPQPTIDDKPPPAVPGPVYLQDHHNQVQFRNIWILEKSNTQEDL